VVLPAYNAERTLSRTYEEICQQEVVDEIILVDDGSLDNTVTTARALPRLQVHEHQANRGYGGEQKNCHSLSLSSGAGIIVMVHPDYQYDPQLIPAMVSMIGNRVYPCVLGSRILGGCALKGGMPLWKYIANRFLTCVENVLLGAKLSEY